MPYCLKLRADSCFCGQKVLYVGLLCLVLYCAVKRCLVLCGLVLSYLNVPCVLLYCLVLCDLVSGNIKSSVCMDIVRRTYRMETNEVWK